MWSMPTPRTPRCNPNTGTSGRGSSTDARRDCSGTLASKYEYIAQACVTADSFRTLVETYAVPSGLNLLNSPRVEALIALSFFGKLLGL